MRAGCSTCFYNRDRSASSRAKALASGSCSTMAEVLAECGGSLVPMLAGQEPEGSVKIDGPRNRAESD